MLTTVLILALVSMPYVLDVYFSTPRNSESEENYDYR